MNNAENNGFYNYLMDNFDNCKILENGDYHVSENGNHFFFSSDCTSSDVNLLSYYPGIGDTHNDTYFWINDMKKNGVPSGSVIMISSNDRDSYNTFKVFDDIATVNGINASTVQSVCFSGSGDVGFKRLNDYVTQHSNLVDSSSLVVIDGYVIEENVVGGRVAVDTLIDNQIPIYMITPDAKTYSDRVKGLSMDLSEMGFNTYLVEMESNEYGRYIGHGDANKLVLMDGFAPYMAGVSDELGKQSNYKFYKFENGEYVSVDIEDARINLSSYAAKVRRISLLNDISMSELASEKYYVKSDAKVLQGNLNNIIGLVRNSLFVQNSLSSTSFYSTSNVPAQIPLTLMEFFSESSSLLLSLTDDMYQFAKIGLSIEKLDDDMKNDADNLV